MARPILIIPHLFRLADAINFRKDYSPPSSPPSRPFHLGQRREEGSSGERGEGAGEDFCVAVGEDMLRVDDSFTVHDLNHEMGLWFGSVLLEIV